MGGVAITGSTADENAFASSYGNECGTDNWKECLGILRI